MEKNTTTINVCAQCGTTINQDFEFCPNCGTRIGDNSLQNNQDVNNSNFFVPKKPLAKCAWFAPVAIIILLIIDVVFMLLGGRILSHFNTDFAMHLYYAIGDILTFIIRCVFISVFYLIAIAISGTEKRKAKVAVHTIFFTYVINAIPLVISSAVSNFLFALNFSLLSLSTEVISIVPWVIRTVLTLLFAVLSYFVTAKYFEFIDSTFDDSDDIKTITQNTDENYEQLQGQIPFIAQPNVSVSTKSNKSKTAAGLLCFFLGGLGIHRFYVGKIGTGILWMFTAGLFGIGTLIDFVIIICGGFKDVNGLDLS